MMGNPCSEGLMIPKIVASWLSGDQRPQSPLSVRQNWNIIPRNSRSYEECRLTTTRPPFGGLRWWFVCPATGRLCAKLFLPLGRRQFLSRTAYRLGYACQRVTMLDRRQRKAAKLRRALGGNQEFGSSAPEKPKGMHWRTYERRMRQLEVADVAVDRAWLSAIPANLTKAVGFLAAQPLHT
jgi:hypothetical protein